MLKEYEVVVRTWAYSPEMAKQVVKAGSGVAFLVRQAGKELPEPCPECTANGVESRTYAEAPASPATKELVTVPLYCTNGHRWTYTGSPL